MTLLGVILLILGLVLAIKILWVIGVCLLAVGLIVFLLSKVNNGGNGFW